MQNNGIVNIIHLVRGSEPRDRTVGLTEPAENQLRLLREHRRSGAFPLLYRVRPAQGVSDTADRIRLRSENGGLFLNT